MKFEDIQAEIDNVLDVDTESLTPEQIEAFDAYLADLAAAEADKIDSFCRFIRMKLASAEAKRAEARRLAQSADSDENTAKYLKTRYLEIMQQHGLKTVRGGAYKLSIRATPYVQIVNFDELPKEYITEKITQSADKLRLRDDLKTGKAIPGATLGQSFSLQVA